MNSKNGSNRKQLVFYGLFAIISTLINLLTQRGSEFLIDFSNIQFLSTALINNQQTGKVLTLGYFICLFNATVTGFVFKYFCDKLVVFKDTTATISTKHFKMVLLYGIFAILTTIIFWSFSAAFKLLFTFNGSAYLGSIIGLTIGYTIKFYLDSKFVFNSTKHNSNINFY